jgi:hypothetical protein
MDKVDAFFVGMMTGLVVSIIGIGLLLSHGFNQRAIELNYAGYNVKTGDFEWYNKDAKYLVIGEKDK